MQRLHGCPEVEGKRWNVSNAELSRSGGRQRAGEGPQDEAAEIDECGRQVKGFNLTWDLGNKEVRIWGVHSPFPSAAFQVLMSE